MPGKETRVPRITFWSVRRRPEDARFRGLDVTVRDKKQKKGVEGEEKMEVEGSKVAEEDRAGNGRGGGKEVAETFVWRGRGTGFYLC